MPTRGTFGGGRWKLLTNKPRITLRWSRFPLVYSVHQWDENYLEGSLCCALFQGGTNGSCDCGIIPTHILLSRGVKSRISDILIKYQALRYFAISVKRPLISNHSFRSPVLAWTTFWIGTFGITDTDAFLPSPNKSMFDIKVNLISTNSLNAIAVFH